jgi:hypothetical protein
MIDIKIEIPEGLMNLPEKILEVAKTALREIATDAQSEWKAEAMRKLKTTAKNYSEAVKFRMISDTESEVYMEHGEQYKLVNAIERGKSPWSIKDTVMAKAVVHPRKRSPKEFMAMKMKLMALGTWGKPAVPYAVATFKDSLGNSRYRSISAKTSDDKWQHPGFRPDGKGGLKAPLREHVITYVQDKIPDIFSKLFASIKL